jgi:hypothetical protein
MRDATNSIDVHSETDANGEITLVRVRFGPHYLLEVRKAQRNVSFELCYTHHGFKADASGVDGELERIIEEIRRTHPEASID